MGSSLPLTLRDPICTFPPTHPGQKRVSGTGVLPVRTGGTPVPPGCAFGNHESSQEKDDMSKYVYFFGGGKAEGRADMKELLGGKGANLAEMTNIGLPVPAGFTITTEVCTYYANDHKYTPNPKAEVDQALRKTEEVMGAKFG